MREIKFRVWDKENKQILDVQELDYGDSYNGQPMIRTTMYNDYFDTEDMILMQYTGLKDKNEKEIYEGDILEYKTREYLTDEIYCKNFVVKWNQKTASYILRNSETTLSLNYVYLTSEVIGNIYDNPELLERK